MIYHGLEVADLSAPVRCCWCCWTGLLCDTLMRPESMVRCPDCGEPVDADETSRDEPGK
jgi:hypothetical protein